MDGSGRRRGVVRYGARFLLIAAVALGAQFTLGTAVTADPTADQWAELRMCESSDRYHINTGTGYYGAYQFDLPTWRSVGGSGYPHQASRKEQDYRALYLYRMRGWQPWECAYDYFLGLEDDGDARSKVVPSYADSAYISGGDAQPAPDPAPSGDGRDGGASGRAWPGVVYAYGDCSDRLRTWQLRMNTYGYDFQGTGCYYDETRQAVLDLQRANGIRDSGRLGPKTWKAAWDGNAPEPGSAANSNRPTWPGVVYTYGDCASALKAFQLRMNTYGYDFQGTGCYYDETRQAVLDLQRANGIRDSGKLGPKTWKAAWEGKAPR